MTKANEFEQEDADLCARFANRCRFPERYGYVEIDRRIAVFDNNPINGHESVRQRFGEWLAARKLCVTATAVHENYTKVWLIDAPDDDWVEAEELLQGLKEIAKEQLGKNCESKRPALRLVRGDEA